MPKITRKGQVTIPKRIRDSLGLKPGSEVNFRVEGDTYLLGKKVKGESIAKWVGFLGSNKTSDEIIEELRGKVE